MLYQFSSVTHSCPTLWDPMNCSMPSFPVHQLPELAQTHVHRVGDAIHPFHPLSSPSPPALNLSQHQEMSHLFKWVSSLHQVAKVLEFQLQHQSFQWIFRTDFFRIDWFDLLAIQATLKSLVQNHSSKSISSSVFNLLYGPTFTSIHDYKKKNIDLTIWTSVSKVMSLLFNVLSRLVIAFLPRSKHLLIPWLQ